MSDYKDEKREMQKDEKKFEKRRQAAAKNDGNDAVFNLDGIRQLVELMKENNVSELDLEQGRSRLKLRRGAIADVPAVACVPAPVAVPTAAPDAVAATESAAPSVADDSAFVKTIDSPMVGTFYATPSPNAAPFVAVGDVVGPEKTVCIVEAMKVFNEIQAETSGKIVAVLVKSGDAVEYGTPLFKIDVRG